MLTISCAKLLPAPPSSVSCGIASGSSSGAGNSPDSSAALSRHAAGEKPLPTLAETMRHLSFSYSCMALRSFWTCRIVENVSSFVFERGESKEERREGPFESKRFLQKCLAFSTRAETQVTAA